MITTGYYGKTSARGDFVSHRLPQTFVNVWDDWAQQLVLSCQQNYPDNFDKTWYQLPSYRFVLSAGLAGEMAWLGILIPSSDSVGRNYPLCFARPLNSGMLPNQALMTSGEYFHDLESLISKLISSDYDFNQLAIDLEDIDRKHQSDDLQSNGSTSQITLQSISDTLSLRVSGRLDNGQDSVDLYTHAVLTASCGSYSMWVTSDISNSSSETLLFEGLPGFKVCGALFDGEFATPHWSNVVIDTAAEQSRASMSSSVVTQNSAQYADDKTVLPPVPAEPIVADLLEFDDDDESNTVPWDK